MDRGAWWAIIHGVARAAHDLVTACKTHLTIIVQTRGSEWSYSGAFHGILLKRT